MLWRDVRRQNRPHADRLLVAPAAQGWPCPLIRPQISPPRPTAQAKGQGRPRVIGSASCATSASRGKTVSTRSARPEHSLGQGSFRGALPLHRPLPAPMPAASFGPWAETSSKAPQGISRLLARPWIASLATIGRNSAPSWPALPAQRAHGDCVYLIQVAAALFGA